MAMAAGEWFRIESGEHEGRWHLAGWMESARRTMPTLPGEETTWLAWGDCPRCGAMVFAGDDRHPGSPLLGTRVWAHEDWHARTDYPHPAGEPAGRRRGTARDG